MERLTQKLFGYNFDMSKQWTIRKSLQILKKQKRKRRWTKQKYNVQ
jgi:hypothetical protein